MLQKLRDKTSGWVATVVIGLLIVPLAFMGVVDYFDGGGSKHVAKVQAPPVWWQSAPSWWPASMLWQHHEVSYDEFRSRFDNERSRQREELQDRFDSREFETIENKLKILDQLIDEQVLRLAAERAGVVISDQAVYDQIKAIPAFQTDGKFDQERYVVALASGVNPRTPLQFQTLVRESLQYSLIPAGLASSAFVSKGEMERMIKLLGETRDVTVALMPEVAVDEAPVSDADIQKWYGAHPTDFKQAESVTIEYVELNAANLPAPAAVDEATLRKRYQDEQSRFMEPEQRLASHILIKLDAGADEATRKAAEAKATKLAEQASQPSVDFAALARENSEDPGSKAAGGDLGWVASGVMVKPFEDALFAMQPGEIKGPVKTDYGYHILQLREVNAGKQVPFEKVRDQLAQEQAQAEAEQVFNDLGSRLMDAILKEPTELAQAAKTIGVPVQTLGPFSRSDAQGIASTPAVLRAAFSETLIQDGTVSDPIELAPNHNVFIRVVQHTPEQTQPLDKVREKVIAAVQADRSRKTAAAAADALLARLAKGEKITSLVASENLQVNAFPGLQRQMPAPTQEATRAIFSVPAPAEEGKPSIGKVAMPDGRYLVFEVEKVIPGDLASVPAEQQEMLMRQLSQLHGEVDSRAYTEAMRKRFKVVVDESRL